MVQGAPIAAEFTWPNANCSDVDEASTGELRLFVGGRLIWGVAGYGVHWHWLDLLEGLSENWSDLLYEGWLESTSPPDDSVFTALERYQSGVELQVWMADISREDALALQGRAYAWEQTHFLSRFMPGLDVPDVAVWGDKAEVYFETDQFKGGFSRAIAASALSELGDAIALRLDSQGFGNHPVVAAWQDRRVLATDRFAANLVEEDASRLAFARSGLSEAQVWGDEAGQMANTIWTAAAEECRGADREVLRDVFQSLANLPPPSGSWLDCLYAADRTRQAVAPHEEAYGILLSGEVRDIIGIGATEPFGVDTLARGLGLRLISRNWGIRGPAGLAVHKPGDAPAILLNADALGFGLERERRWLVVSSVSKLHEAGLKGIACAVRLDPGLTNLEDDRFALELLVPLRGLEEFVLGKPTEDPFSAACWHFGVPRAAVAMQLRRSQVHWSLPPHIRDAVTAALRTESRTTRRRHLQLMAA